MNPKQVLEIFVEQGIVDSSQVDEIAQEISQTGKSLAQTMVDYQFVTEDQFYQTIADSLGMELVDLKTFEPPNDVLRLIPAGSAQLHKAFPIGFENGAVQVALADPLNPQTAEDLRFSLGKEIQIVVAPVHQIDDLIRKYYGTDAASMDEILAELGGGELEFGEGPGIDLKNLEAEANSTPIIRYVDVVLYQAIRAPASDILFVTFATEFKSRYHGCGAPV